ncbi:hypothetical protein FGO68_gene13223 [Halteria grandinella]|uniref:Uncharacterized protein n=1 Tax=Halteria grandinella TaxID=5974 RepID=A0A8J8NUH7_HALGN|nr:hypothetical protein FGO68_gene13223 [Halteria grandinella]
MVHKRERQMKQGELKVRGFLRMKDAGTSAANFDVELDNKGQDVKEGYKEIKLSKEKINMILMEIKHQRSKSLENINLNVNHQVLGSKLYTRNFEPPALTLSNLQSKPVLKSLKKSRSGYLNSNSGIQQPRPLESQNIVSQLQSLHALLQNDRFIDGSQRLPLLVPNQLQKNLHKKIIQPSNSSHFKMSGDGTPTGSPDRTQVIHQYQKNQQTTKLVQGVAFEQQNQVAPHIFIPRLKVSSMQIMNKEKIRKTVRLSQTKLI